MFWFFGHKTCGILAPWPGIEPAPPALEGETNHWTTREVLPDVFYVYLVKHDLWLNWTELNWQHSGALYLLPHHHFEKVTCGYRWYTRGPTDGTLPFPTLALPGQLWSHMLAALLRTPQLSLPASRWLPRKVSGDPKFPLTSSFICQDPEGGCAWAHCPFHSGLGSLVLLHFHCIPLDQEFLV